MAVFKKDVLQSAEKLVRKGKIEAAIKEYKKVVARTPGDTNTLNRLADLYRESGRNSKAMGAYQRIATMMIERGQVDHAIQVYDRALQVDGGNLDFISQAVLRIRDAGGEERAMDLVERAERRNPEASQLRALVTRPRVVLGGPQSADAGASSDALDVSWDLDPDPARENEESRPSLVDPSTFGPDSSSSFQPAVPETRDISVEAPVGSVVGGHKAVEVGPERVQSLDLPQPSEPFALGTRRPPILLDQEASPRLVSPPAASGPSIPDPPRSTPPEALSGRQLVEGAPSTDLLSATDSGEFDLGEIGDISTNALDFSADLAEPENDLWGQAPVESARSTDPERSTDVGRSTDVDEVDLDAAFDRQVDPGPIRLAGDPKPQERPSPVAQRVVDPGLTVDALAETPARVAAVPHLRSDQVTEKLSEAAVFKKYGLLDKALERFNEVLALAPDHLEALSEATLALIERGDEARAATKAETLLLLCAQRDERQLWERVREQLVAARYEIDGNRIRTPGELAMQSGSVGVVSDPYDDPSQARAGELDESDESVGPSDFSALAAEPLEIDPADSHDMLDSKEFPLAYREVDEGGVESLARPEPGHEIDGLVSADEDRATPNWLDVKASGGNPQSAEDLFDDEEEFFDLASELQDELGTDLHALEESLPENAAEQSLEEIVEGFKRGVAENISEEDSDTHYNLGIAYREMMLIDEAINEFQISAKSADYLVESCAMLGLCFREKGLPELAAKWYRRGVEAPQLSAEQQPGMMYELADSLDASGDLVAAKVVFAQLAAADPSYRDVARRLELLGPGS